MIKSLILGVTGQDGSILANKIVSNSGNVIGTFRRGSDTGSENKLWRLKELNLLNKIKLEPLELNDSYSIQKIILKHKPDEIYHLAGNSFVGDSFKFPQFTLKTNIDSTLNILEAVKLIDRSIKVFFASSSEIFDSSELSKKNEKSKFSPINPYGVSKLTTIQLVKLYRKAYDMKLSTGIMFNHESQFRSRSFVTRKISFNMARLKLYGGKPMSLGNINASRDWSSAEDFVDAMNLILNKNIFEDLVFASGKLTSIKKLIETAAKTVGFEPIFFGNGKNEVCIDKISKLKLVEIDKKYFREIDTPGITGDFNLLTKKTGWVSKKTILTVIQDMVKKDLDRLKNKI